MKERKTKREDSLFNLNSRLYSQTINGDKKPPKTSRHLDGICVGAKSADNMQPKQRFMVVSFVELVLMCFLLMSIVSQGKGLGDGVVILTRGSQEPPTRSVTAVEGGTLFLHCSVSTYMLREVWWGKTSGSGDEYLTDKELTRTNDSRVSVSRSANFTRDTIYYRTYTIRISPVAVTDATNYFCLSRWKLSNTNNAKTHAQSELLVSVTGFQNGNRNCWSTCNSINGTLVWCETEHAYPSVNITWTVQATGKIVSVTIADVSTDGSGRNWVRSSYQAGHGLQNQVLVCTIESSAFPDRNQTCSVTLPPKASSTTLKPDATIAQTESTSESSETITATATDDTTMHLERPDSTKVSSAAILGSGLTPPNDYAPTTGPLTSTTATALPESPSDVVTVSAAVVIPSFTLLLVALLLCILRGRKRRPGSNGRGKNSGTTTGGIRSNCEGGRPCGVIATPVTRMPQHGSRRTMDAGGDAFDSPYEEVELDHPVSRSAAGAEAPGKDGLGQNTCVIYQTVHPADDSDCDTSSWESDSLHQERVNSYNDNVVTGGDSDKFEASPAGSDESDGRMVDNAIYQSYDDEYPSH